MSWAPDVRVGDVIRGHAARRPEAVALCHGERELGYGELDERSNRLAQALLASGVGAGTRVAYLDRSSTEVVELLIPYDRGDLVAAAHREGEVLDEQHTEGGVRIRARLDAAGQARLADVAVG